MATKKVTVPLPEGGTGEGVEIGVTESTERWSEVSLEDGTILRIKMTLLSAIRLDDRYDAEGNPIYVAKGQPVTAIVSIPQELKKKQQ